MTRFHASRGAAPLSVLAATIGLLCAPVVQAETDLGELVITDFADQFLDAGDGPFVSQGANIGNPPHQTVLSPSAGSLTVGDGVEWTNTGRFWVGSHFGLQNSVGSVLFESGSTFNNAALESSFPDLPQDVRIGQGGAGTVTLEEGATWNNVGVPNNQSFRVGDQGLLTIQGQLYSDASSTIDGGTVTVQGTGALWEVGGFGLDVEGVGQPGRLEISGGGQVTGMWFGQIGFSNGNSGQLVVGEAGPPVFDEDEGGYLPVPRSLFAADFMEIGVYGTAQGTVEVGNGGRVEIGSMLRMGREGGTGLLEILEGGEVLVGGFFGGGFYGQTAELWSGSTIDLSDGGKMVIGTDTTPLNEPVPGAGNAFDDINPGTLLVGYDGTLKGTGTVIGDVLVTAGGTLSPGHSPGRLIIDGDLSFGDDSTLVMEIGGIGPGQYDRIEVSGLLTLGGGSLVLSFVDGFAPDVGESFELDLFDAVVSGYFSDVQVQGLVNSLSFDLNALASGDPVTFSIVPVPAALPLLLSGIAGLVMLRRRRS